MGMKIATDYHKAICRQMLELAKGKVLFIGQQVLSEDFYDTLTEIPLHMRREMPVAEELQMGMSIGLSLEGITPISIYQRMDFLPRAMDQIVNHLNLISKMSRNIFNPKVIVRTTVGTTKPLDCGLQHSKDLTHMMRESVNFHVMPVKTVDEVNYAYHLAKTRQESICIIEYQELYYQ